MPGFASRQIENFKRFYSILPYYHIATRLIFTRAFGKPSVTVNRERASFFISIHNRSMVGYGTGMDFDQKNMAYLQNFLKTIGVSPSNFMNKDIYVVSLIS